MKNEIFLYILPDHEEFSYDVSVSHRPDVCFESEGPRVVNMQNG